MNHKMNKAIRTLTAIAATATLSCAVFAQSAVHYRAGDRVDPNEVARILLTQPQLQSLQSPLQTRSIRMRSIRLLDGPDAAQTSAQATAQIAVAAAAAPPSSMSLPIRFGFDSAQIEADARPQLDALAAGIKMLPPDQPVSIEGHTDAVGSPEYNQTLSMRRALAVRQYLAQVHGIDARRLHAVGLGETQPIEAGDPYAARNRRVQFHGG